MRSELAALEREGYLTHPHTSAGRVPTESGYRFYADALLASRGQARPSSGTLDLSQMRREIEEAMRETASALSRMTDLLAVATAPPPSAARIHRVEALQLQPARRDGGRDRLQRRRHQARVQLRRRRSTPAWSSGLRAFSTSASSGLALGARMAGDRLDDPELGPAERGFLAEIGDAFTGLEREAESDLYVEGAARLLSAEHAPDLPRADSLMRALERRANLLEVLRSTLDERSVFMWIGGENPSPELRSVSVVGANYGLGYRNLGTVGVVGPLRMDYATAIASVREAAGELSRFFETVYE